MCLLLWFFPEIKFYRRREEHALPTKFRLYPTSPISPYLSGPMEDQKIHLQLISTFAMNSREFVRLSERDL